LARLVVRAGVVTRYQAAFGEARLGACRPGGVRRPPTVDARGICRDAELRVAIPGYADVRDESIALLPSADDESSRVVAEGVRDDPAELPRRLCGFQHDTPRVALGCSVAGGLRVIGLRARTTAGFGVRRLSPSDALDCR